MLNYSFANFPSNKNSTILEEMLSYKWEQVHCSCRGINLLMLPAPNCRLSKKTMINLFDPFQCFICFKKLYILRSIWQHIVFMNTCPFQIKFLYFVAGAFPIFLVLINVLLSARYTRDKIIIFTKVLWKKYCITFYCMQMLFISTVTIMHVV